MILTSVNFIRRLMILTIVSFFFSVSAAHDTDPTNGQKPPVGWAKIRIWETKLPERSGHVSLETSESYISIWPNSESPQARTVEVTSEFTPYVHAPALSIGSYEVDLRLEENELPKSVYLITLNSKKIDEVWKFILNEYAPVADASGTRSINFATWFAPSGSIFPEPDPSCVHINCASAVLKAMKVGGIDTQDLLNKNERSSELLRNSANLLTDSSTTQREAQQLVALVGIWGFYESIVKPNDISAFLQTLLHKRATNKLKGKIEEREIDFSNAMQSDADDIIYAITQRLPTYQQNVKGLLSIAGTVEENLIGGYTLTLNEDVLADVKQRKQQRATAVGALIGGLLGGTVGGLATDRRNQTAGIVGGGVSGAALGAAVANCFIQ